jgi:hypothetical protein
MKKLITLLFVLFCYAGFGQVYQLMPQYGYQANRFRFDSTLQIPTVCGVPTLKSNVTKLGAIAFDSCNNRFYTYNPKTATWSQVSGGGSTDTTSLSARIDARVKYTDTASMLTPYFKRSLSANDTIKTNGRVLEMNATRLTKSTTLKVDTVGITMDMTSGSNTSDFVLWNGYTLLSQQFGTNINQIEMQPGLGVNIASYNASTIDGFNTTAGVGAFWYVDASDTIGILPRTNGTSGQVLKLQNGAQMVWANDETGSVDTTSLSNRINLKVDSVKRRSDSVFAYRNGTEIYQFKDSVGTNPPPNGYYGAFQDNTTQTAASINTAYPVKFNTTDLTNGVTISNNTRIKIANAGIYNIQFSLQLEKTGGSGNMITDIWLRKNGVNIDGTTGKVVLTGSANASPIVAAWNYLISVSSGDSIELMWSTNNTNVEIVAAGPTSPHPSIPSSILTVTQQSGIMAGTGISPLDTANMLAPYLRETDTASLSSRINSKLTISDTSTLQRKQLPAYSFIANGTNAAANGTATYFKDTSGTYTGTITWTGTTAPSGTTNHSYRWTRVGKCVTLNVNLVYATNGGALTAVVFDLPSDAPTPAEPAGLTGASQNMYPVLVWNTNASNALVANSARGFLRNNSGNNAYEFVVNMTTSAVNAAYITLNYWTD